MYNRILHMVTLLLHICKYVGSVYLIHTAGHVVGHPHLSAIYVVLNNSDATVIDMIR